MTLIDIYLDSTSVCVDSFIGYLEISYSVLATMFLGGVAYVTYNFLRK